MYVVSIVNKSFFFFDQAIVPCILHVKIYLVHIYRSYICIFLVLFRKIFLVIISNPSIRK